MDHPGSGGPVKIIMQEGNMGAKGRKNVKKPKKEVAAKKTTSAAPKKK